MILTLVWVRSKGDMVMILRNLFKDVRIRVLVNSAVIVLSLSSLISVRIHGLEGLPGTQRCCKVVPHE